ncbi:hypothetical protein AOL_s00215g373 [Orbilia oligospora ATCC 24927]|uniref:Rhodanese domain-containing protein n=2 Tax=Orbilia oligospora TaxID=2813651 RepID=G1XU94_ARTOA|nr:hypothetical protein AOL_s00215g373 [Orbilia oligospora ATCC 24927]EGX43637.1 hypothetical protein AOL_s00215g373 [Orbilia oligospora ATCC 24927]KAF3275386.1 hypothetical protein TWF970_006833 [Orbilia oligospora]
MALRLLPPSLLKPLLLKSPSYLSPLPQLIPINATWFLPNDPQRRTGAASHKLLRIPHSRFFDIDEVKNHAINLPHMLPPTKVFVEAMRRLKIRREDHLVFYDSYEQGILAAPRAAWTAKLMGHEKVSVLNNFKVYVNEGYEVVKGEEEDILDYEKRELSPEEEYPENITAEVDRVVAFDEVLALAKENLSFLQTGKLSKDIQILDARPNGRFTGKDPEPRAGLSSGHLPGSISVPFVSLLGSNGELLDGGKLREVLERAGVKDDGKTKITSCGTGVTASVIDLALEEAGFGESLGKRRVYDGSWTEWAQKADKELILKD